MERFDSDRTARYSQLPLTATFSRGKPGVSMCLAYRENVLQSTFFRHVWRWKEMIRIAQHGFGQLPLTATFSRGKPGVSMCWAFIENVLRWESEVLTNDNSFPIDFSAVNLVDSENVGEEAALGWVDLYDRAAGQHVGHLLVDHLVCGPG